MPGNERPRLSFVLVGTPRSGTTLVQRLASEIPGVRVPPETHFWSHFLPAFAQRQRFPLDEAGLRLALNEFARMPTSSGLSVRADQVVEALGGSCPDPETLYQQLVVSLAGPASHYGEKTPGHLAWWARLAETMPGLKFIFVVRDPRGVAASFPFADRMRRPDAFLAARWRADQREVIRAVWVLGSRALLLRYEDVVSGPERARMVIADLLGMEVPVQRADVNNAQLYLPWEKWKQRAAGPIDASRCNEWRTVLTSREISVTERICRREMKEFGYELCLVSGRVSGRGIPGPVRYADVLLFRWRRHRRIRAAKVCR